MLAATRDQTLAITCLAPERLADVIGDLEIPPRGGKMLRTMVQLEDSHLVIRVSRRHGKPKAGDEE
jgi:hypothetical protein